MESGRTKSHGTSRPASRAESRGVGRVPEGLQAGPFAPLVLSGLLLGFTLLPRIGDHPALAHAFLLAAGFLVAWSVVLWAGAGGRSGRFAIELPPVQRSHWIQSSVQVLIYAYWGWYWRDVYAEVPLILAQLVFLFAFDALLAWSRGRAWRVTLGPLPIILSINVFLWFKDDWYLYQFLMVAVGALGKEFIRWQRDGRSTHVFNPSAFTLGVFSLALIATGATDHTWGTEITLTFFRPPHIYLQIFLLGLVVQAFFPVVLMTFSAAAVLYGLNLAYTSHTGIYYFVDTNIAVPAFLGFHLLVTDPSTSPRSNGGKVLFGATYGLAIWAAYGLLGDLGAPQFYDKLLPIPLLNLGVRFFDRLAATGLPARLGEWARGVVVPRRMNLVHMGCWAALFSAMLGTGFVEAPHEGASMAFWRTAWEQGKPHAGEKLLSMIRSRIAMGSASANDALGSLLMEGRIVPRDLPAAADAFGRACALGSTRGCENLVREYLQFGQGPADDRLLAAGLARLRELCAADPPDVDACLLVGYARETGKGLPADLQRALTLYETGVAQGDLDACRDLLRLGLSKHVWSAHVDEAVADLQAAGEAGDPKCLLDVVPLFARADSPRHDEVRAQTLLQEACRLGSTEACKALGGGGPPGP